MKRHTALLTLRHWFGKTFLLTYTLFFLFPFTTKAQQHHNIDIEEYDSLIIYYPQYEYITLSYGREVPFGEDVLYCCAGAFTAKCLKTFSHDNIRCNHVSEGKLYQGSEEPVCNGMFAYYDGEGHWDFANRSLIDSAVAHHGMAFAQVLIIYNDSIIYKDSLTKKFWIEKAYVYRALCEKEGKICIIQSRDEIPYAQFVNLLTGCDVHHALYLDMGGWGHACYCDNDDMIVETTHAPTQYATNWLVFKRNISTD